MRQLSTTGWIHNRLRLIVASFLTKHLLIDWREGEKWFWENLIDGDRALNAFNWQWVAGCGADAAPYFRIFNPILQGEKFDKEGVYVKKWVPELSKVPKKFIHKPWEMELKYQEAIKTIIGKDYPGPIVVHEKARTAALEAFQSFCLLFSSASSLPLALSHAHVAAPAPPTQLHPVLRWSAFPLLSVRADS